MAPIPPIWMAIEEKFEKPQSAYVAIAWARGESSPAATIFCISM
jgi:hypothetical protein